MLSPRSGVSGRLGKSVSNHDRGNVNWSCVNYCNINLSGHVSSLLEEALVSSTGP